MHAVLKNLNPLCKYLANEQRHGKGQLGYATKATIATVHNQIWDLKYNVATCTQFGFY